MARVRWTLEAVDQLDRIAEYIATSSETNARRVVHEVIRLVNDLQQHPMIGSEVAEYDDPEIRERLTHGFRIIYRYRNDLIEVLTVIHGARRLPRRLPESGLTTET